MIKKMTGEEEALQVLLRDYSLPYNTRACYHGIMKDGRLVGVLWTWDKTMHDSSQYFFIFIEPDHRGQGLGSLALDYIKETCDRPLLQCGLGHQSTWLEARGFKVFRVTYEDSPLISDLKMPDHKHVELMALRDLDGSNWLDLAGLVKEIYTQTHLDNPVKALGVEAWLDLIRADVYEEASFVCKTKQGIQAFGLCHMDHKTPALGWRGTQDHLDETLLSLILYHQLKCLKDRGYQAVDVEIDTTDPYMMTLFKDLSISRQDTWYSYQYRKDAYAV